MSQKTHMDGHSFSNKATNTRAFVSLPVSPPLLSLLHKKPTKSIISEQCILQRFLFFYFYCYFIALPVFPLVSTSPVRTFSFLFCVFFRAILANCLSHDFSSHVNRSNLWTVVSMYFEIQLIYEAMVFDLVIA